MTEAAVPMATPPAEGTDPDAHDIRRSRDEPESFTAIYDRHFHAVHGYLAGRLGPEHADDLAAETFLVAFRKRRTFDPARGSVRGWLFGVATKLAAQHRRTEARRLRALARIPGEPAATGHEERIVAVVAAQGMRPRLAGALEALPRGERDVVLLTALAGLSHVEIAQALAVPYGTVGSRLSRARKRLRAALDQEVTDE